MRHFLFGTVLASLVGSALAADVGVSVSVGQPGFYGRIDIGNMLQPQLVYQAPMIIQPLPIGVVRQPIYLHVPPGHAKKWDKHCHRYNACGQPVYFVQESWYQNEYQSSRREERRDRYERYDDRDHDRSNNDHGNNGRGNGKGHNKHGHGND